MPQPEKLKKILMVEDDVAMREIVIHKLMSHGFEVKEAEDGKQGIDLAVSEKPDLILLDLMLPEVDGFKVLETVRANPDPKVAETPIIILSNLWSNKDILRTKALKVQAYMVKAYFTTEEILSKINEILAQSRTEVAGASAGQPPAEPGTPTTPTTHAQTPGTAAT
jgi:two-component system, OmpR family, alkaline phosphatase synthesis response regulator PhoP